MNWWAWIYTREKLFALSSRLFHNRELIMDKCPICFHSRAAHVDGMKCALCRCTSERREFVQQSLTFRSALPASVITNTRKR